MVSKESKALAAMISAQAPMADYLKLLLGGEHQAAARLAWKMALAAAGRNPGAYSDWTSAVAVAVRCHDQTGGGRAADFLNWTQGKLLGADGKPLSANPLAGFLRD